MEDPARCWERGCIHFEGMVQPNEDRVTAKSPRGEGEDKEVYVCTAFPEGIPQPIVLGEDLHNEPVKGDHGVQFEPDPARTNRDKSEDPA